MNTPLRREFVSENSSAVQEDSMDVSTSSRGPINQLVLGYLSHHGYAKTARAFQAQCELRGSMEGSAVSAISAAPLRVPSPGIAPIPVPAPQSHGIDLDIEMDTSSPVKPSTAPFPEANPSSTSAFDGRGPGMHDGDIELRTHIVNAVISGDIDTALQETARCHPKVLEKDDGLMLFKLRCRKFVELILGAAEVKKKLKKDEGASPTFELGIGAESMDVDDDMEDGGSGFNTNGVGNNDSSSSFASNPTRTKRKQSISTPGWTGAAFSEYESALSSAITYGQTLQSDYKSDNRPEVIAIVKRTFGVVAYVDPLEAGGEAAEVAGHKARLLLATELNQEILRTPSQFMDTVTQLIDFFFLFLESQGRPARPVLESLYRQTSACITQLGLLGVGAAAFADMPKELLEA